MDRTGYPSVYAAFPMVKVIVYFDIDMRVRGNRTGGLTKGSHGVQEDRLLPQFMGRIK